MRILYVCHQFFPRHYAGTERYTLELAKHAQRMGHSVSVLTYAPENLGTAILETAGVVVRAYEFQGLPIVGIAHKDFGKRGGWPAVSVEPFDSEIYKGMVQFLRENAFDIVHCVHPMRLGAIVKAAREIGLKVVLTLMDYWVLCPRGTLLQPDGVLCEGPDGGKKCISHCYEANALEQMIARYNDGQQLIGIADTVISHSKFLIDLFRKNGVNTSKFVHLRNGMDYGVISRTGSQGEVRRGSTFTIGFLGTLLPHKGVHILIEAFRKVPAENLRLKLFGSSFGMQEYDSHLLALADGDSRIEFCGEYEFENIATVVRDIDCVVVPSIWYENAPLVISAAQMFGIPVIATGLGGMAEIVIDGVNGLTFELGNVEDLTEKIRLITENRDVLTKLGDKAIPPPRVESEAVLLESLYFALSSGATNRQDCGLAECSGRK